MYVGGIVGGTIEDDNAWSIEYRHYTGNYVKNIGKFVKNEPVQPDTKDISKEEINKLVSSLELEHELKWK